MLQQSPKPKKKKKKKKGGKVNDAEEDMIEPSLNSAFSFLNQSSTKERNKEILGKHPPKPNPAPRREGKRPTYDVSRKMQNATLVVRSNPRTVKRTYSSASQSHKQYNPHKVESIDESDEIEVPKRKRKTEKWKKELETDLDYGTVGRRRSSSRKDGHYQ
jgi:hypothetical protein